MKTLIIYDNNGNIYVQMSGSYIIPSGGVQYLETEVPNGKTVSKIDTTVTPNTPIYEDLPLTDIEKINTQMTAILKGMII